MQIKAFRALRPPVDRAGEVASVPYDVVSCEEARQLVENKPWSFLRVVRPEVNLPADTNIYSDEVYAKGRETLRKFEEQGVLVRDDESSIFVYRLKMGDHIQRGIVTCCRADDVEKGVILRHEKTREDKLKDRIRLLDSMSAHTGPIFLTYRNLETIDALVAECEKQAPMFSYKGAHDVEHTVWRMKQPDAVVEAFGELDVCYVADGHHRLAAACEVARRRKDGGGDDNESDWLLGVLFPADQMNILPYNRCVSDLNGLDETEFLTACERTFDVMECQGGSPATPGEIQMYFAGKWYALKVKETISIVDDPVSVLDVSVLQNQLLNPILGIDDPRTNKRISFVGGIRGTDELVRTVDGGEAAVAFVLYPVTVEQMMDIADADMIMPPKSTWFEPKLNSGLLVHTF